MDEATLYKSLQEAIHHLEEIYYLVIIKCIIKISYTCNPSSIQIKIVSSSELEQESSSSTIFYYLILIAF